MRQNSRLSYKANKKNRKRGKRKGRRERRQQRNWKQKIKRIFNEVFLNNLKNQEIKSLKKKKKELAKSYKGKINENKAKMIKKKQWQMK